ncbi:MAG: CpaF family protein, partial [Lachnospiraceae bacterium]|nr:CpaF family protein [Lachnospiraceae bacterium]
MTDHDNLRQEIREALFGDMDYSREISDEEMFARIDRAVSQEAREREIPVAERKRLREEIFSSI